MVRENRGEILENQRAIIFLLYVSIHISGVILNVHVSGFDEIERACEDFSSFCPYMFREIDVCTQRCPQFYDDIFKHKVGR